MTTASRRVTRRRERGTGAPGSWTWAPVLFDGSCVSRRRRASANVDGWHCAGRRGFLHRPGLCLRQCPQAPSACQRLSALKVTERTDGDVPYMVFDTRSIPAFPTPLRRVIGHHWPWYRLPGPMAFQGLTARSTGGQPLSASIVPVEGTEGADGSVADAGGGRLEERIDDSPLQAARLPASIPQASNGQSRNVRRPGWQRFRPPLPIPHNRRTSDRVGKVRSFWLRLLADMAAARRPA
jgi:hypothetical protein